MQQRSSSSSSRAPGDHSAINIRMDDNRGIPDNDHHSTAGKREIFRSRFAKKWVHAIPVIVVLCIFLLWWFSYPVNLVIKDGRITAINRIEMPLSLNDTLTDLSDFPILAVATSSIASVPVNLTN